MDTHLMHSMNGCTLRHWCACQISPHDGSVISIIWLAVVYVFEYNFVWLLWHKYSKRLFVETGKCIFCELLSHFYTNCPCYYVVFWTLNLSMPLLLWSEWRQNNYCKLQRTKCTGSPHNSDVNKILHDKNNNGDVITSMSRCFLTFFVMRALKMWARGITVAVKPKIHVI